MSTVLFYIHVLNWLQLGTKFLKSIGVTTSWAAVGSVTISPSLRMAQVTPQNRQLIGRPESIRAMQAAFKQQDKSWGAAAKEEGSPKETAGECQCPNCKSTLEIYVRIRIHHCATPAESEWARSEDEATAVAMPHMFLVHTALVTAPLHLQETRLEQLTYSTWR